MMGRHCQRRGRFELRARSHLFQTSRTRPTPSLREGEEGREGEVNEEGDAGEGGMCKPGAQGMRAISSHRCHARGVDATLGRSMLGQSSGGCRFTVWKVVERPTIGQREVDEGVRCWPVTNTSARPRTLGRRTRSVLFPSALLFALEPWERVTTSVCPIPRIDSAVEMMAGVPGGERRGARSRESPDECRASRT